MWRHEGPCKSDLVAQPQADVVILQPHKPPTRSLSPSINSSNLHSPLNSSIFHCNLLSKILIEKATTAYAISPSCATRITPRGIIRGDTPSLSSSSWHRRSTAVGGGLTIRCQAKDKSQDVEPGSTVNPTEGNQAKSTTIWDALAFSGPGPERINGRLAMVGFVSALAVEAARGEDLVAQLADGGVFWFIGAAALFSVASLVPLFRGVDAPERSSGFMTADVELLNGRFAMLGLVGLAFTEFLKGGPLV